MDSHERDFDDRTIPLGRSPARAGKGGVAAKLVVLQGDIRGEIIDLTADELRIGRHGDNDLVLPSEQVSRHHARMLSRDGRFFFEDLKSFNGSMCNDMRLEPHKQHLLTHQDTLQLCEYQLLFLERGGKAGKLDLSTIHLDTAKVREEAEHALRNFLQ